MDSNFRFLPTEEELVHYLRKKKQVDHIIPEIDISNYEPWDVPGLYAGLFTEPDSPYQDMFFFSPRVYKYIDNNYARTNSATARGFWKTTGKERVIKAGGSIGRKRTLIFYEGNKTNWVMDEYSLIEDEANPTPKLAQQKIQDKKDTERTGMNLSCTSATGLHTADGHRQKSETCLAWDLLESYYMY